MNFLPFLRVRLMLVFSDSFPASLFLIKRGEGCAFVAWAGELCSITPAAEACYAS